MLSSADLAGISAGGAAVIAAAALALVGLGRRRRLDAALGDPDPSTRMAALDLIARSSARGHVEALVDRVLVENNAKVMTSLVDTVLRTRFRSSSSRRVLLLRSWATRMTDGTSATHVDAEPSGSPEVVAMSPSEVAQAALPQARHPENDHVDEAEFERLEHNEQQVLEWLLESGGSSPTGVQAPGRTQYPQAFAKAEERALELLREAGYGVISPPGRQGGRAGSVGTRTDPPAPEEVLLEFQESELIRELRTEQEARLDLLERMISRVRADNARWEIELRRLYNREGP